MVVDVVLPAVLGLVLVWETSVKAYKRKIVSMKSIFSYLDSD